jgi:hypothetical protein
VASGRIAGFDQAAKFFGVRRLGVVEKDLPAVARFVDCLAKAGVRLIIVAGFE